MWSKIENEKISADNYSKVFNGFFEKCQSLHKFYIYSTHKLRYEKYKIYIFPLEPSGMFAVFFNNSRPSVELARNQTSLQFIRTPWFDTNMQNDTVWKIPTYIFEVLIIDCGGGQVSDGIDVASVWIGPGTRVALVVENNAK